MDNQSVKIMRILHCGLFMLLFAASSIPAGAKPKSTASKAMNNLRRSAEMGDTNAQNTLGAIYCGMPYDDVTVINYAEAYHWFKLAADQGDGSAMLNLGDMYEKGEGVARSYPEAMKWYRCAAEKYRSLAMLRIGIMYEKGNGVIQSNAEAFNWYYRAANSANTIDGKALYNVGRMYENGLGVKKSNADAELWYRKAAIKDIPEAKEALLNLQKNRTEDK